MKNFLYLLPVAILLFSGCAQKNDDVHANFLMPPKEIKDVNDVKNIKIKINSIKLNGLSNKKAKNDISNMIKGKLSALTYKEQFLNVDDDILNNKNIRKFNKISYNHHGYGKFTKFNTKNSVVSIDLKVKIKKTKGKEKVTTNLYSQRYTTKQSKGKYPRPIAVRSGKPSVSSVSNNVPFVKYVASADMYVKLYNTKNKLIYKKEFKNIKLTKVLGGSKKSVSEVPTDLSIIAELISEKLRMVVADLSPHNESRKLIVNTKGDVSSVLLMKATAFSEAYERLDIYIEENQIKIDKESKVLNDKLKIDLKKAKDEKSKNELIKSNDENIKNLSKPFSADFENMGILMEIFGELTESSDWYNKAAEVDATNNTARISAKRVQNIFRNQRTLKKMLKKDNIKAKSKYKSKENGGNH